MSHNLRFRCREIMHAGEGPPGKVEWFESTRPMTPSVAAEKYVEQLHDWEKRREDMEDGDFDRVLTVVEVHVGDMEWQRFCVRCRVVREYSSEPVAADFVS